jgi:uncharacterized protein (TIGR03067 family)
MRRAALLVVACVAGLAARPAAADDAKPGKKDADRLQGTWRITEITLDGKEVPAEGVAKIRFTFDGEKLTYDGNGDRDAGSYKLDVTTSPRQIDMLNKAGEVKSRGIYKFDDKELIWCYARVSAGTRPEEFRSKAGSGIMLMRLRQVEE